jgi:Skp family chaperone for outer membrane proteins
MNHQDIQKAFNSVSSDIDGMRKSLLELQAKASDRKELLDLKGKLMAALEHKVEVAEMQSSLSNAQGDLVQKIFDLRSELFDKIGDIQSYTS